MKRNGQTLKVVPDGSPRRMADAKNAWRKMSAEQRVEYLTWLGVAEGEPEHEIRALATEWTEPAKS